MNAITKLFRSRILLFVAAFVITYGLLWIGFHIHRARLAAKRCNALGRLSQMRVALQQYEYQYGTLPPLYTENDQGKALHSWRALILPFLDADGIGQLDLTQPWDSKPNRKVIEDTQPMDWAWFARDKAPSSPPIRTHIFALLGENSIWDTKTRLPRGTTQQYPDKILLVSVPESQIEPLQPVDITETDIRRLVENGHEVLFITANASFTYGIVTIENGKLTFPTTQN